MTKNDYIARAIEVAGRMTDGDIAFALSRLERLPSNAAVSVCYFFAAAKWFTMSTTEKRALGADFALRQKRGEFAGLLKGAGSNANLYAKR